MSQTETLHGVVRRVFFCNPESPFTTGVIETKEGEAKFAGSCVAQVGDTITLKGHWTQHPKFGTQLQVEQGIVKIDESPEALANLLASHEAFAGIGPARAQKIAEAAQKVAEKSGGDPTDLTFAMTHKPEVVAQIAGVQPALVVEAAQEWSRRSEFYGALAQLTEQGWTPAQGAKILKKLGNGAPQMVEADPYMLIGRIARFGFKTVDVVARKMGIASTDPMRLQAGVAYCLDKIAENGSTWTTYEALITQAMEELKPDTLEGEKKIREAADELVRTGIIYVDASPVGTQVVANSRLAQKEIQVFELMLAGLATEVAPLDTTEEHVAEFVESLNEGQRAALEGFSHRRFAVVSGGAGVGKAQPLDAKVLTPTGWTTMGEIRVGDLVVAPNGKPVTVRGVYPQGERDIFKVTMTDGSATRCCEEHLWSRKTQKDRDRDRSYSVMSLGEIVEHGLVRGAGDRKQHWIPIAEPIEFDGSADLPIDPYVMGVLLGDGGFTQRSLTLSNESRFIQARVRSSLPEGMQLSPRAGSEREFGITYPGDHTNPVKDALRELGLMDRKSIEKFIPERYLRGSVEQRIELLRGLMDTDGTTDGHRTEFSSSSPMLAAGFRELVEQLGGTCRVSSRVPSFTYKGEKREGALNFRMWPTLPEEIVPFSLPAKAEMYKPNRKYKPRRAFDSVELDGRGECQCIAVDGEHYITDDSIVTHNTYTMRAICEVAESNGMVVELCAPTGKAARKLSHATERDARTIHRLLEPVFDEGEFLFTRNKDNPIDADLVVVDEVSMVDVRLMWSLLMALPPRCRLLLVGDHHQIPSVGPGAILRDLLAAQAKYPEAVHILSEVVRQAGVLARNTTALLHGVVVKEQDDAWGIMETERGHVEGSPAMVAMAVESLITAGPTAPYERDLDFAWDVQVLAPQRKGPFGTYALNVALQKLRQRMLGNPPPEDTPEGKAPRPMVGDRVIWTKNDYQLDLLNGTQAIVMELMKGGAMKLYTEDGRQVTVPVQKRVNVEVAYAMTIHKSQGSEWPCVMLIASSSHWHMHDRNLLYTGASRASEGLTIVGDRTAMANFAKQQKSAARCTFGGFLIHGWRQQGSLAGAAAPEGHMNEQHAG